MWPNLMDFLKETQFCLILRRSLPRPCPLILSIRAAIIPLRFVFSFIASLLSYTLNTTKKINKNTVFASNKDTHTHFSIFIFHKCRGIVKPLNLKRIWSSSPLINITTLIYNHHHLHSRYCEYSTLPRTCTYSPHN